MSFNTIRENKILNKSSKFTVHKGNDLKPKISIIKKPELESKSNEDYDYTITQEEDKPARTSKH